ncbi:hypothetical protein SRHO_G00345050 [Serrasalmus rhombeus]
MKIIPVILTIISPTIRKLQSVQWCGDSAGWTGIFKPERLTGNSSLTQVHLQDQEKERLAYCHHR